MIIETLIAATLLMQEVKDPEDVVADTPGTPEIAVDALGEDGFAGEGGLDASFSPPERTPYTGPRTVVCTWSFQAGRRRPNDLEVSCPAGDLTEEVEARAYEVMNFETRRNTDSQMRRDTVRGRLVLNRNLGDPDRPDWLAETAMVLGAVPSYPNSQARRGAPAICTIVFHVIDNQAETQDVTCLTPGLEEAFERVSGRVVERYVFVGDEDLYCQSTSLSFWFSQPIRMPPPPAPHCEIPDAAYQ